MGKKRKRIVVSDNEGWSTQRLKFSFVRNLWAWYKLHVVLGPLFFVDFVEWLG